MPLFEHHSLSGSPYCELLKTRHNKRLELFNSLNNHYKILKKEIFYNDNNKRKDFILLKCSLNKDLNNLKIKLNSYYNNFLYPIEEKRKNYKLLRSDIQRIINIKQEFLNLKQKNKYVYDNSHI